MYPWGDDAPDCSRLNYRHDDGSTYEFCVADTSQVGSYPTGARPYCALDMSGNVWDWVNDWYSLTYYSVSPYSNLQGPDIGTYRKLRGVSCRYGWNYTHAAYRNNDDPTYRRYDFGFWCAGAPGE